MTNHARKTKAFFNATTPETKRLILSNIAAHYGITTAEAEAEVTHPEAESLLDYVTGPERSATHILMQRHNQLPE